MPTTRSSTKKTEETEQIGEKRQHHQTTGKTKSEEPQSKSVKHENDEKAAKHEPDGKDASNGKDTQARQSTEDTDTKDTDTKDKDDNKKAEALEKGHIYFFYRPKVDVEDSVESIDEVQKLYMVLKPYWSTEKRQPTLVILGSKKLPTVDQHARYWGFVGAADDDISKITEPFKESSYETKTRGTRKIQPARPVAEGVYTITSHNGHSHLAYITTAPKEPGTVQEAFNIEKQASLIISVKNPQKSNPPQAGLRGYQKPDYPQDLQASFQDRRFIAMATTKYLNYQHCELLFIGATQDLLKELGDVGEDLMEREDKDEFEVQDVGVEDYIFKEMKLAKEKVPVEPLQGEWK
ncbi:hypothetical protein INT43_002030 [Umbelopsis isabellina]|uniref:Uncharacterized protein n=1 Tax=Mortierella isabellina TaxID=91625 RepID=A0A8H7UDQ0_MORIS|nr:hypothetical protein INT43_002030 [Umbelopsis isabellina]